MRGRSPCVRKRSRLWQPWEVYGSASRSGQFSDALLGSQHASLYPPSRRRTTLRDLPKLCGLGDVRQGMLHLHLYTAKIDFTYECSDCGGEVMHTVTKPELLN